jgi:FkbM family methyltransferase
MKKTLKSFLHPRILFLLRKLKNKIFPNKYFLEEKNRIKLRIKFYSQFIKENDLCFDIGANIGNRINPLLTLHAKVIAVEPQKACCDVLKWEFGKKITIIPYGVGAKEEYKNFYISNDSTLSSFSETWINSIETGRFKNNKWNKIEPIKIVTLDSLIDKFGIPQFIKIDVEGFELEVLKGLSCPIPILSFEYAVPEQTENVINCIKRAFEINNNIVFNYCVGEHMDFILKEWIDIKTMEVLIKSDTFINSGFGDIYVKNISIKN